MRETAGRTVTRKSRRSPPRSANSALSNPVLIAADDTIIAGHGRAERLRFSPMNAREACKSRQKQISWRRWVQAMGGMAAQIPIRDDPAANEAAMAKVRADKEREAGDGHDGSWGAHPGLVPITRQIFDRRCRSPTRSTANARTCGSPRRI